MLEKISSISAKLEFFSLRKSVSDLKMELADDRKLRALSKSSKAVFTVPLVSSILSTIFFGSAEAAAHINAKNAENAKISNFFIIFLSKKY